MWKFGNIQKLGIIVHIHICILTKCYSVSPYVFCVYFQLLSAWEGSNRGGSSGGALHKNHAKTIEIGVESGIMEVSETNFDIQHSG